jgi:hypothetical protein
MTFEKLYLITLGEIRNIRFECIKCHSIAVYEPERWSNIPHQCRNCEKMWILPTSEEEDALAQIQRALKILRKSVTMGCKFQFELVGELQKEETPSP